MPNPSEDTADKTVELAEKREYLYRRFYDFATGEKLKAPEITTEELRIKFERKTGLLIQKMTADLILLTYSKEAENEAEAPESDGDIHIPHDVKKTNAAIKYLDTYPDRALATWVGSILWWHAGSDRFLKYANEFQAIRGHKYLTEKNEREVEKILRHLGYNTIANKKIKSANPNVRHPDVDPDIPETKTA